MTETVKRLRGENPYIEPRSARDTRFWTMFQQDFYTTIIRKKSKTTHEAQYVDWDYMARKNNAIFNEVMAECAKKGSKHSWASSIVGTGRSLLSSMSQCALDTTRVREPYPG